MSTAAHPRSARALGVGLSLVMVTGAIVALHDQQAAAARVTGAAQPAAELVEPDTAILPMVPSTDASAALQQRSAGTRHHASHHAKAGMGSAATSAQAGQVQSRPTPVPTLGPPTKPAKGVQAPYRDVQLVPTLTELATLPHGEAGYSNPTTHTKSMEVPGSWYGRISVLPIVAVSGHRIKVRTAQRPNMHEVWINRSSKIYRSATTYAIVVDLRMKHLFLFKSGRQIGAFPVGIGVERTPTPTGSYFVAFHAAPNGPGYGSVMLETSAHSDVFKTFDGGNDAIIAIHGPIDEQANQEIGKTGARVSNGCIRMHDPALSKVGVVPDGTPVILTR